MALACIEAGLALGYVDSLDEGTTDRFDHVIGTLVRLVK